VQTSSDRPSTREEWGRLVTATLAGLFLAGIEWLILRAFGTEHVSDWDGYAALTVLTILVGDMASAMAADHRRRAVFSLAVFGIAHALILFLIVERKLYGSGEIESLTFGGELRDWFLWVTGIALVIGLAARIIDSWGRPVDKLLRRLTRGG
jgi:hypothetical protein